MNYDPILVALVAAAQMLDDAEEDQVDPHFAVQVQGVIGSYLHELSREDMSELRRMAARIADERASSDPAIADHLRRRHNEGLNIPSQELRAALTVQRDYRTMPPR